MQNNNIIILAHCSFKKGIFHINYFIISDCTSLYNIDKRKSGVFRIRPRGTSAFPVYCDMTEGGWTVFLNRFDGSENFDRDWNDYKEGFGNLTGEFWLGNEKLYLLTNQRNYSMKMEVTYWNTSENRYALYKNFKVEGEDTNYTLHTSGYTGNTSHDYWKNHNLMKFSTRDQDNDIHSNVSCAQRFKGGDWYNKCFNVHCTGPYEKSGDGMELHWATSHGSIYLKKVKLKIKAN